VHVLQGERELVDDCRSLARFELRNIPPMVAGAARIRVTFEVDADGLLAVSAKEQSTGVSTQIQVKPSYGLTDKEIESMLRSSLEHAKEEVYTRQLREQQVEAKRVIEAIQAALKQDSDLLSKTELSPIEKGIEELKQLQVGTDRDAIKAKIKQLDQVTANFAQQRMDMGIKQALAGHQLTEFE
jgi:molecular chaperone HscA